jgi:hypothetical protein
MSHSVSSSPVSPLSSEAAPALLDSPSLSPVSLSARSGAPSRPSAGTGGTVGRRSVAGPSEAELLAFVRAAAADTALTGSLPLDPDERTWLRLDGPGGSEAWLIGWPPGAGTGWHDHAESLGAFAVARGRLVEHSLAARLPAGGWRSLELQEDLDRVRELAAGQGRSFGRHHVHEVLNEAGDGPGRGHAVSVHAYHPPLPLIRRFHRDGVVLRLEQVESAEEWA